MHRLTHRAIRPALLFLGAYLVTNLVNSVATLVYWVAMGSPAAPSTGGDTDWLNDPAYQATVAWHPFIALAIFTAFALLLRRSTPWLVGLGWMVTAVVIDAVVYVWLLGDTRWGLPPDDYYIGNQPWITLTYLALLLAPPLALTARRAARGPAPA